MDHIVVILVHFNNETDTNACLASLLKIKPSSHFTVSVLVVDNGSLQPYTFKTRSKQINFQMVRNEKNIGFTGGNNLGIWYARERLNPTHIVLLNNDTIVAPDFLEHLHRSLSENPHLGAVSPKIYFTSGREYHSASYRTADRGNVLWYAGGSIDSNNLAAFHRGVDEVDYGHFDKPALTEFCTGCCVMMPIGVIEKVGTLDKRYFLYMEDVDLSQRVARAGYSLGFVPASKVWHTNAGSSGGAGSAIHEYYQNRNRLFFFWLYGQWRTRLTACRLAWQLVRGNSYQRRAVFDLVLGRMGKQPVL
jgi:GT2 family glycosyltransferase